jgi:hypothetical protein
MDQQQTWVTSARIEAKSAARRVLIFLFWIWGLLGLLATVILALHANGVAIAPWTGTLVSELSLPTWTETMLLWIGGMILFGVGAAAAPISYEFKMLSAPAEY